MKKSFRPEQNQIFTKDFWFADQMTMVNGNIERGVCISQAYLIKLGLGCF
jgi:hypothetical protein